MKSYHLGWSLCPHCGYAVNAASIAPGQGEHQPRPMDVTVCLDCGALLEFDIGLRLLPLSAGALNEMSAEKRRTIEASQKIIWARGRLPPQQTRRN